jgi:CHAT domain-containing protein
MHRTILYSQSAHGFVAATMPFSWSRQVNQYLLGVVHEPVSRCHHAVACLPRGTVKALPGTGKAAAVRPVPPGEKPYAHPYNWSAFVLIGDPGWACLALMHRDWRITIAPGREQDKPRE